MIPSYYFIVIVLDLSSCLILVVGFGHLSYFGYVVTPVNYSFFVQFYLYSFFLIFDKIYVLLIKTFFNQIEI